MPATNCKRFDVAIEVHAIVRGRIRLHDVPDLDADALVATLSPAVLLNELDVTKIVSVEDASIVTSDDVSDCPCLDRIEQARDWARQPAPGARMDTAVDGLARDCGVLL